MKKARSMGLSREVAEACISIRENWLDGPVLSDKIMEDDKVCLDVEKIKNRKDYERLSAGYKEFVSSSAGKVFTAHVEKKNLISLKENPVWLFWSGDLTKYTEQEAHKDGCTLD